MTEGLSICFDTWSYQHQEGFVFLSEKSNKWKDFCFQWPEDKDRIEEWIQNRQESPADLYWCPLIFSQPRRQKKFVLPGRVLFADLDPVDPRTVQPKPTIAWASSKDRYQALWWLSEELEPPELENVNKALTYHIGADRGGWDLTQVLRIPGSLNHKYDPPQEGKVLWAEKTAIYNKDNFYFSDKIDQPKGPPAVGTGLSLVELLSKHRKKIPEKISRLLQYPPERVEPGYRSDILWYIENGLVQARIPLEDIISMVQQSAWNKYRGRADEWKRLTTEIMKVYENSVVNPNPSPPEEPIEESEGLPWRFFSQVMAGLQSQPGWLVRDIWLKRSHGILAGEPKSFKSTIALDLAVSVASGQPLWGQFPVEEVGPVLIIQNENAEWIVRDRLEKILTCKGLVGRVQVNESSLEVEFAPDLPLYFLNNFGYNFSDLYHREELEKTIERIKPVLTIFDPLYLMFEGEINSAKDLHPVLFWLLELKNTHNTGIMVIHHWNKGGSSPRGGQRMLGSTTLHGWTESGLFLQANEGGRVTVEREFRAAGILPKLDLAITMGGFGDPLYRVDVEEAGGTDHNDLLDLLSMYPGGLSVRKIAKELKVSRRQVSNLIERVKTQLELIHSRRGSVTVKLKAGGELNESSK